MKKQQITIHDSRINRDNNAAGYKILCKELVKSTLRVEREFGAGWTMSRDSFATTSYKNSSKSVSTQVEIILDFNNEAAVITEMY